MLPLPAVLAQAEQLQPVFLDLIAGAARDGVDQRIQVVAFEERDAAAALAQQEMLVPGAGGDEGLAAG